MEKGIKKNCIISDIFLGAKYKPRQIYQMVDWKTVQFIFGPVRYCSTLIVDCDSQNH